MDASTPAAGTGLEVAEREHTAAATAPIGPAIRQQEHETGQRQTDGRPALYLQVPGPDPAAANNRTASTRVLRMGDRRQAA